MAIALAFARWGGVGGHVPSGTPSSAITAAIAAASFGAVPESGGVATADSADVLLLRESQVPNMLACLALASAEEQAVATPSTDIWDDPVAMHLLREGVFPEGSTKQQRDKAAKRRLRYVWHDSRLHRVMPDGQHRLVPPPDQRQAILQEFHRRAGHFGSRRTCALVASHYWWHGMLAETRAIVERCQVCDRVRASFNARHPTLHPLPIAGLFYRWGVDLTGPFPSPPGSDSAYIMIAIEHYSKFLVAAALPNKASRTVALAFATGVLAHFGAPAEVVTDQGSEFQGEFDQLLLRALVDHRVASPHHPQTDGLAERAVGTLKRALRKLCEDSQQHDWDMHLAWVALGYNASPQQSTGFPPYLLLYARVPTVPPAVRERIAPPVELDPNSEAAAADLLVRAAAMRQACITAGANLRIAQQRDTLRYARLRSGEYQPRLVRFQPGDLVYVQDPEAHSLQISARPHILRVVRVGPTGTLTLEGRDGRTVDVHTEQCAPCHLPNVDTTVYKGLLPYDADVRCARCASADADAYMLLCDHCGAGWHTYCLPVPLLRVPVDDAPWVCPACSAKGVRPDALLSRQQAERDRLAAREADRIRPAAMHGMRISRVARTADGEPAMQWGTIAYTGADARTRCLVVQWEDGQREGPLTARSLRHLYGRPIPVVLPPQDPVPATHIVQQSGTEGRAGGGALADPSASAGTPSRASRPSRSRRGPAPAAAQDA
jgi:transposase InsO family protein